MDFVSSYILLSHHSYRAYSKTCYNANHWSNHRTSDNPNGYTDMQAKKIAAAPRLREKWRIERGIMNQRRSQNMKRGKRKDSAKVIEDMANAVDDRYRHQSQVYGDVTSSIPSSPRPQVKTDRDNANRTSASASTSNVVRSSPIPSPDPLRPSTNRSSPASAPQRGSSRGTRASSGLRAVPKPSQARQMIETGIDTADSDEDEAEVDIMDPTIAAVTSTTTAAATSTNSDLELHSDDEE
jgi:hypothetical protein